MDSFRVAGHWNASPAGSAFTHEPDEATPVLPFGLSAALSVRAATLPAQHSPAPMRSTTRGTRRDQINPRTVRAATWLKGESGARQLRESMTGPPHRNQETAHTTTPCA